jgi:large subunit ribosomal protein L22
MEARAINRYIPTSPRKMRLVIDLIRGKSADEALHLLHFSPKHASKVAEKVLRSAIANLQNKDDAGRIEPEDIRVKEAFVDAGMVMKRISPAPMGRAYRIRKRSNHVTIIVSADDHGRRSGRTRPGVKPAKAEPKAPKSEAKPPKGEAKAAKPDTKGVAAQTKEPKGGKKSAAQERTTKK